MMFARRMGKIGITLLVILESAVACGTRPQAPSHIDTVSQETEIPSARAPTLTATSVIAPTSTVETTGIPYSTVIKSETPSVFDPSKGHEVPRLTEVPPYPVIRIVDETTDIERIANWLGPVWIDELRLVDYSANVVFILFAGTFAVGPHELVLQSVQVIDQRVQFECVITEPKPDEPWTNVVIYPFQAIAINRSLLPSGVASFEMYDEQMRVARSTTALVMDSLP